MQIEYILVAIMALLMLAAAVWGWCSRPCKKIRDSSACGRTYHCCYGNKCTGSSS